MRPRKDPNDWQRIIWLFIAGVSIVFAAMALMGSDLGQKYVFFEAKSLVFDFVRAILSLIFLLGYVWFIAWLAFNYKGRVFHVHRLAKGVIILSLMSLCVQFGGQLQDKYMLMTFYALCFHLMFMGNILKFYETFGVAETLFAMLFELCITHRFESKRVGWLIAVGCGAVFYGAKHVNECNIEKTNVGQRLPTNGGGDDAGGSGSPTRERVGTTSAAAGSPARRRGRGRGRQSRPDV